MLKKLIHEFKQVAIISGYFLICLTGFQIIKELLLLDYKITFTHTGKVIIGALILGKVVFVLERIPIGRWLKSLRPISSILLKSLIYSIVLFLFNMGEEFVGFRFIDGNSGSFIESLREEQSLYQMYALTIYIYVCFVLFYFIHHIRESLGYDQLKSLLFDARS